MGVRSRQTEPKVTVKIPRVIYDKVGAMIEGKGYNSVTDFVVYVLRDLVATQEMDQRTAAEGQPLGYRQDQLEKVKARLRALGDLAADEQRWRNETQ